MAAILACLLILVAIPQAIRFFARSTYQTAEGEVRVLVLPDGSRVHLNSQTRVAVHFGRDARAVDLVQGEALFDVVPDSSRPFRVRARGASAQALGTQFDVQLTDADLLVTVYRGRVKVAGAEKASDDAVIVVPEQRAVVHLGGDHRVTQMAQLDDLHLRETFAWTGTLALTGMPLKDAVARFNRANTTQMIIADQSIGGLRVGGTISLIEPDVFARALGALHVRAELTSVGNVRVYYLMRNEQKKSD